uniref:Uncharacterized protein n=1 Tax=Anguilla anguilla TaxID=7936 RepID=A0A0E9UKX0_ANGAN
MREGTPRQKKGREKDVYVTWLETQEKLGVRAAAITWT